MYDSVHFMKFPVWYSIKGYSFSDEQMCVSVHSTCAEPCFLTILLKFMSQLLHAAPKQALRAREGEGMNKNEDERVIFFCPCKVNGCSECSVSRHSSRAVSVATATASHLALSSERSGQERVNSGTSHVLPH